MKTSLSSQRSLLTWFDWTCSHSWKAAMPLFGASQLQRLKEHKYSSEGRSFSEPAFQILWNRVITWTPLWIAPNAITVIGLLINVVTCLIIVMFNPQARTDDSPRWPFFMAALGLFAYQTLDAIDGKQARRTGNSTPLGELFDHGCDSVSTYVLCIACGCAVSMGNYPTLFFFFFVHAVSCYYVGHWQSYVSGTLRFGKFDVTEVQVLGMLALTMAGIYGPAAYRAQVPLLPYAMSYSEGLAALVGVVSAWFYYTNFKRILKGGVGKNGTTVAQTSVLSPIIPFGIVMACAFYLFKHSDSNIFRAEPCLFTLFFGTVTSHLSCKLVVAAMSKSPLEMLDYCMLGPLALAIYVYFNLRSWLLLIHVDVTELHVLKLALVFNVLNFVQYSYHVCTELSNFLNISVFTIPYRITGASKSN